LYLFCAGGFSPLGNYLLITLSLLPVTILAQGLEIICIKEVATYRPWNNMIHDLCGLNDSLPPAFSAQRMLRPEDAAEPRPPVGVVKI